MTGKKDDADKKADIKAAKLAIARQARAQRDGKLGKPKGKGK